MRIVNHDNSNNDNDDIVNNSNNSNGHGLLIVMLIGHVFIVCIRTDSDNEAFLKPIGSIGHVFTVRIRIENQKHFQQPE